jgi:hypothetical protein
MRQLCQGSGPVLQYGLCVATTSEEKHEIFWNVLEIDLTLHQKSEMISLFDILIQQKYKGLRISTLGAYYISLSPD